MHEAFSHHIFSFVREVKKFLKFELQKKEQEMKAKAEAEKLEQERLLKIKKDEEEKLERKRVGHNFHRF